MKILNNNNIYSIRANSTKVFANSTNIYANTTTLSFADNIKLIPRKAELNVRVEIRDEMKDLIVQSFGTLEKEKESYSLSFDTTFPFKNDNRFELTLTSLNDGGELLYRGKMLVTDQQTEKFNYDNE